VRSRRRLVESDSDSSIVFTLHSCRTGRSLNWIGYRCRGYGVSDECLARRPVCSLSRKPSQLLQGSLPPVLPQPANLELSRRSAPRYPLIYTNCRPPISRSHLTSDETPLYSQHMNQFSVHTFIHPHRQLRIATNTCIQPVCLIILPSSTRSGRPVFMSWLDLAAVLALGCFNRRGLLHCHHSNVCCWTRSCPAFAGTQNCPATTWTLTDTYLLNA
jgi:hypothetical protein